MYCSLSVLIQKGGLFTHTKIIVCFVAIWRVFDFLVVVFLRYIGLF